MLFACSVVIQTAFLAFTLLLTLLGLNYSHEPLTGSNLASVLIVGMFAAMTWHFQFRPLNMMIQRKMILLDDFHLPWPSSPAQLEKVADPENADISKIGRASCRERVCQYV